MRKALVAVATVITAVAVTVIAVPAANAGFTSVEDPRGDMECAEVHCASERRNADIVRATAGHAGTRLKHTIRVVGKFHQAVLSINADSHRDCERRLFISRQRGGFADFRWCDTPHVGPHRARVDVHHHSVTIFFSKWSIGNPDSYGWSAYVTAGGKRPSRRPQASDFVPNRQHWIPHQLGR